MWRTSEGDRALTGAEGALFHCLATCFSDDVIESCLFGGESVQGGAPIFDRLTPEQQVVVLSEVIPALLDPSIPPIEPMTAYQEGAIYCCYLFAWVLLDESPARIERMIRRAMKFCGDDGPFPAKGDRREWMGMADWLSDRVLWDLDFMTEIPADLPPQRSKAVMTLVGIHPDYFMAVPDDPKDVTPYVEKIRRYTGVKYSTLRVASMPLSSVPSEAE